MAFNKSKALEAAQKLVTQGKLKDAVAEYLKIHNADPKDQNVLNLLGDLNARLKNLPEALTYYGKLADMYVSDGFLVRGIAMYKKISKLDPASTNALERLADLYTMQGLMSEARAQYLQLAEAYLKANQGNRAMEVMQKLLDLEPDNLRIQQRLADLYERHQQPQQAAAIYRRLADRQLEHEQVDDARKWLEKAAALAPDSADLLLLQARVLQQSGEAAQALATLEKIPNLEQHPEAVELLLRARLGAGQIQAAEELAEKLFATDPTQFAGFVQLAQHAAEKKDGARALGLLQRVAEPAQQNDPYGFLHAVREVASLLGDSLEAFELLGRAAHAAADQSTSIQALSGQARLAVAAEDFARAKQLYDDLVTLQPDNADFSAQLRQMREKLGEPVAAVEAPTAAAAPAAAAPAADAVAEPVLDEETQAFVNAALTDIDLFSSYGMTDKAIELAQQLVERVPNHVVGNEKLLDFYLGSGNDLGVAEIARRLASLHRQANNEARAEELTSLAERYGEKAGVEVGQAPVEAPAEAPTQVLTESALHEVDLSAEWAAVSGTEETAAEAPPAEPAAAAPAAFNPTEAGEEIDFYLAQGLQDQARAAVERYEQQFPDEPAVAELRARLEGAAAPAEAPPAEAVPAEAAAEAAPAEAAPAEAPPAEAVPQEAAVAEEGQTYDVVLEEQPQPTAPAAGAAMSADEFFSDLAGDLDQALETAPAPPAAAEKAAAPPPAPKPAPVAAKEEPKEEPPVGVLADVFEEFKEEMGEVEEVEDIETHYNLGIAYKEMGLLDEAISEFQKASKAAEQQKSHANFYQCCILLGHCFMEKEHPKIAVRWYERALKVPGVDEESALALRYDMGTAHEQAGNRKAALDCYMEVYGVNVDYRNVGERIRELQGA